jgi:hypothetical protein
MPRSTDVAGGFTAHDASMLPLSNYEATKTLVDDRIGDLRRAGDDTYPTYRTSARRRHLSRWFR